MTQQNYSYAPPLASTFPIQFTPGGSWPGGVQTIEVDNGSNLTLSVYADGQLIRTVGPYIARFNVNTSGGWGTVRIVANTATIQPSDSVTIILYDSQVVPPLLPAFGVSSWGGGSTPNALVGINPGDNLLAWQVQQIIDLLTGVMTGQLVDIANSLRLILISFLSFGDDNHGWWSQIPNANIEQLRCYDAGAGTGFQFAAMNTSKQLAFLDGHTAELSLFGELLAPSANVAGLTVDASGNLVSPGEISAKTATVAGPLSVQDPVSNTSKTIQAVTDGANSDLVIWNNAMDAKLLSLADAGNLSMLARITSPATGPSQKPLLNYVPITPVGTIFSGTGASGPNAVALNGIPSTAVAVSMQAGLTAPAGTVLDVFGFHAGAYDTDASIVVLNVGTVSTMSPGSGIVATNGVDVALQISGTSGSWTATLTATGYYEES